MDTLIDPYLAALAEEVKASAAYLSHIGPAQTLYFGGGTPSLLTPVQVKTLIDHCRAGFNLTGQAEISLESNPGDADAEKFSALKAAGVNRISIGVQSFHTADLAMFSRRHTFEDARSAFDMARRAGFDNINVDLIYGAPNQTLNQWHDTLDSILSWKPDHVSLYSLSLEEGTTLTRQVRDGVLPQPDSDLVADMYDLSREKLAERGLIHYEISNWALPLKECRHNIQYWVNKPFLGFGAGAHGFADGIRYWNVKPIPVYIERIAGRNNCPHPQFPAFDGMERADQVMEMFDSVILGLRLLLQGVDLVGFEARFGVSIMDVYGTIIEPLVDAGLLTWKGQRLLLMPHAYLVSNQIFYRFVPDKQVIA